MIIKSGFKAIAICLLAGIVFSSCQEQRGAYKHKKNTSYTTGWAYNDPNNNSAERASLRKLPAYGRKTEFWVKSQITVAQNSTFSKMMTIVFRYFFIEAIFE